ncbi:alpha/beta hydrolase [Micromonospora sp. DT228]|uniref:alpha/beta hydrolase n=1 Tax=Micromonospora sp. DT228 TaxID=3393443 RepID=UPI003CEA70CE
MPSKPSRLVDLASVVTIAPLGVAAWAMTRAAWSVYHPKRRPVRQTPASFDLPAERITVSGADGVALACWFIPAPEVAGGTVAQTAEEVGQQQVVVVLGHGMGRNSGMLMPLAKTLHDAGYHVLTFDMRNHGDSADDRLFRGQSPRYAIDHHNVVTSLRERSDLGDFRVACVGFSMSAWTSLECARLDPGLVRAVVCDSGPTLDIDGTIRRTFDATMTKLPRFLAGPAMRAASRFFFTRASLFFLKPAPWPQELPDHSVRLLFIAGEADPVARPVDIRAQLEHYPEAEVWWVPGASHTTARLIATDEYDKRVLALLSDTFHRPAG